MKLMKGTARFAVSTDARKFVHKENRRKQKRNDQKNFDLPSKTANSYLCL